MRLALCFAVAATLQYSLIPLAADPAQAAESSLQETSPVLHQLQRELAELHLWLGPGPNGSRWQRYLLSDELGEAIAQRERANRAVVADVLARYHSGAPGLNQAPFEQVAAALSDWLEELQQYAAQFPPRNELAQLARDAQDQFRPLTEQDLQQARAELNQAVQALDAFLPAGTANTLAWRRYLRWDELQAQLQPEAETDLRTLGEIYLQLTQDQSGLELPAFRNLAEALRRYGDLAALANQPELDRWYAAQLDKLADALEQYADAPTQEDRQAIGESLGRFTSLNLAPELVEAVRYHYSHPNFWVEVSHDFLAHGFRDQISRPTPVQDYILGTRITGSGYTTGDIDLRLIPSYRRGVLEINLTGNTRTNTQGFNRVTIYSAGNTAIAARKWIFLEPDGVRSPPATAAAITDTVTTGISGGALVQRIASGQIAQQRPQANAIASQRAEQRLARSVDAEAVDLVRDANETYRTEFRYPLVRKGEFPRLLDFRTNWDQLSVVGLKASRSQLGAPSGPPPSDGDYDLAVRLHETTPNNFAEALLGGQTLQSEEIRQEIIERRGSLPPELEEADDEEPWSITFARRNPITTRFGDEIVVTIRGQGYTSGDRQFGAMNITARYQVESTDDGLRLIRQGELEIFPPGFDREAGRLGAGDVALRRILQRKFSRLFPEEVVPQGIELGERWAAAGRLFPERMVSEQGWLQVGWRLTPDVRTAAE